MSDPVRAAYAAGLAMLARRELAEAQVRQRLLRKDHAPRDVDEAVARLREAGALDDRRVALAAARTEAMVRSRGRALVLRRLQAMGIPADVAREAIDEVFGALDESALLARALARRLRGHGASIGDAAHLRRLYAQLVRQGFAPHAVIAALRARARASDLPDADD